MDYGQLGFRRRYQCFGTRAGAVPCDENELAIERTVAGGTSPTAVTFLPLITVEYTEDEPTREDSSAASSSSTRWR